jgi:hypothetical protein
LNSFDRDESSLSATIMHVLFLLTFATKEVGQKKSSRHDRLYFVCLY